MPFAGAVEYFRIFGKAERVVKNRLFKFIAIAVLIILSLSSCGETENDPNGSASVGPTSIELSKVTHTMSIGETFDLEATVYPADKKDIPISWETSNAAVATCNDGKITAKGVGVAVIKAKTETSKPATCTVTVIEKPLSSSDLKDKVKFELPELPIKINYTDPATKHSSVISINDITILRTESKNDQTGEDVCRVVVKFQLVKIFDDSAEGLSPSFFKAEIYDENDTLGAIYEFSLSGDKTIKNGQIINTSSYLSIAENEIGFIFDVRNYKSETGRNLRIELLGMDSDDVVEDVPDVPDTPECTEHTDVNKDKLCDNCGESFIGECNEHSDSNADYICDYCGADLTPEEPDTPDTPEDPDTPDTPEEPEDPVTITLSTTNVYIALNSSYTILATVTPEGKTVEWSSTDDSVASCVDGVVTAHKVGNAAISAKVDGEVAVCFVSVIDPARMVMIDVSGLPKTFDYVDPKTGKKTTCVVSGFEVERRLDYDVSNGNYVRITLRLNVEKVYDEDGAEAINPVAFNVNLTEGGNVLLTALVGETKRVEGESFEIKYEFGVSFYEGKRTIVIELAENQ